VPEEDLPVRQPWTQSHLDLHTDAAAGIGAVIWATGYRRDFSGVQASVFDAAGEPVQRRGVTAADGLYFLGLRWMYTRESSFLSGVGSDASTSRTRSHCASRRRSPRHAVVKLGTATASLGSPR
jgi:putative flavoprotein involved in K+ transport